jgi:hypothetical protein
VLDATALEARGVPTVTIVWDNFAHAARSQARLQNLAELAIVVVPHRQGGETAEDQRRKADAALPAVVAKLTEAG